MTDDGQYIRDHYGVPAHLGGRVLFEDRPGRITGFTGHYLLVFLDDGDHSEILHPTWRVKYLDGR